jgi:hypothetical protein
MRVPARHSASVGSLDQLHDEAGQLRRFNETVHLSDVGVIERCEELCFPPKPRNPIWLPGQRDRQHLDCDAAIQDRIVRLVDLAHTAAAQQPLDDIETQAGAGFQRTGDEDAAQGRRRLQQLEQFALQ